MEAMLVYLESLPPGVWIGLWSFSAASLFRRVQFHSIHYAIFVCSPKGERQQAVHRARDERLP